jgi:hypothetical protein
MKPETKETFILDQYSVEKLVIDAMLLTVDGLLVNIPMDWIFSKDFLRQCPAKIQSTLMAADRIGMSARLLELDPKYVDVIVKRWQNYSGRRAVHAETGAEFPEVA